MAGMGDRIVLAGKRLNWRLKAQFAIRGTRPGRLEADFPSISLIPAHLADFAPVRAGCCIQGAHLA
jgi:hypothetical protein